MIIQVADDVGVYIPRFCYHPKLSIAANCRMCLVEVEKAPKPLPACATPVSEGMVVRTRSTIAVEAQQGTMEFLLINHPLDCPVCDQGGECPLQDQAMGYGQDYSRFEEQKRVKDALDLGPLVATAMTRCIHCTRCVRFGREVAGTMELGATGRGEDMTVETYLGGSVDSEVSGNIIDLCPVGALTSKPYRFSARPWELMSHAAISPHDSLGSNLNLQTVQRNLKRVVPRDNEQVNSCWISDRDRFSYEGAESPDRLLYPMVRAEAGLQAVSWEQALKAAA
ncbi:MAG: NADH-quinone oxidoreductase subunit NuoG, partial [Arenicellales bacterium]